MSKLNLANMYIANRQLAESIGGGGEGSGAQVSSGTFTTSDTQYGITEIECGFKPDLIMVALPISGNDTTAYWWKDASWSATKSMWVLRPAETSSYIVDLDRTTGETGIQSITDTGFKFLVNGSNTRGVECKYTAIKFKEA